MADREDELSEEVRALTESPAEADRQSARRRLLVAIEVEGAGKRRGGFSLLSRRGLAIAAALVAVPTAVAVGAAGLTGDDPREQVRDASGNPIGLLPEDCPGVSEAFADAGLDFSSVVLAECPSAKELEDLIGIASRLEQRRGEGYLRTFQVERGGSSR